MKFETLINNKFKIFYSTKIVWLSFHIAALLFCIAGCGESGRQKPPASATVSSTTIDKLKIILETSGSMKGYFDGKKFKENISGIVTEFDNLSKDSSDRIKINKINYFTIDDNIKLKEYTDNAYNFTTRINNSDFNFSKTSPITDIIKMLVDSFKTNEVNVIISDFVIDVTGPNVLPTLKSKFSAIFNGAKQKDIVLLVYRFTSDFTGFCYPAFGGKSLINNVERPYFVWLLGSQKSVKQIRKELVSRNRFNPTNEITFGIKFIPPTPHIFFLSNRDGQWRFRNGIFSKVKMKNKKFKFTLGMNLEDFPLQFSDLGTMKKSTSLKSTTIQIGSFVYYSKAEFILKTNPKELIFLDKLTHFLEINISQINSEQNDVAIIVSKGSIDWYKAMSTDNDQSLTDGNNLRTFALRYIMEGIGSAYGDFDTDKDYFQLKFKVNQ